MDQDGLNTQVMSYQFKRTRMTGIHNSIRVKRIPPDTAIHEHLIEDDTTENKKYISSVLNLFAIPNFYIRKDRPHGHRYWKKEGCKEYHTANQLQKKVSKEKV